MLIHRTFQSTLSWALMVAVFPSRISSSHIDWVDCGKNVPIAFSLFGVTVPTTDLPPALKCGKVVVPMDYSKPISECNNITLSIAMYRPKKPKGVIFYNGGGGDPNTVVAWEVALGAGYGEAFEGLLDYDLMMMDTRGSFDSNALNVSTVGLTAIGNILGPYPTTQEEFDNAKTNSIAFIKDVEKWTSPPGIVQHISAREVAHDYEQIRIALGYEKVNFIALSYGTFRANTYASYYPERVGNFVLDAVVPHNVSPYDGAQTQVAALNRVMYRADAFCLHNSSCPWHKQGKGGFLDAYKKLLSIAPLAVPELNISITALDIQQIVANSLESEGVDFPTLFQNISDPLHGNALNLALSGAFAPNVNILGAGTILLECGDSNFQSTTFAEWEKSLQTALAHDPNKIAQPTAWQLQLGCLAWPYPTPAYAPLITHIPMLLVTSDFDGAAPTEWAEVIRTQALNSVLVVRHGDDHTTFSLTDQPATALMKKYLVTGILPKAMSDSRVSVYEPGMERAPILDPYAVATGEVSGDVNTGNLTEAAILP